MNAPDPTVALEIMQGMHKKVCDHFDHNIILYGGNLNDASFATIIDLADEITEVIELKPNEVKAIVTNVVSIMVMAMRKNVERGWSEQR